MISNLPFARWGNVFGDLATVSTMIDRIVHHADVISLKGNGKTLEQQQPAGDFGTLEPHDGGPGFSWQKWRHFRSVSHRACPN
ncbi:ATP-binding protein [Cryobacterium sp. TMT4-31]|uniref:ATP-binding protein n=1 Tax=Cryobacterium sp. TMT4-31 TaxID=1259259 RepID=UPI003511BA72